APCGLTGRITAGCATPGARSKLPLELETQRKLPLARRVRLRANAAELCVAEIGLGCGKHHTIEGIKQLRAERGHNALAEANSLHQTEVFVVVIRIPEIAIAPRTGAKGEDRKSTRLNSSHVSISYAVFCLKKKMKITQDEFV